ncbi:pro-resilin-like [Zootermopsis nevadensis]|nr:pro-resilin-like [Zootermopsis nevadensis]
MKRLASPRLLATVSRRCLFCLAATISVSLAQDYLPPSAGGGRGGPRGSSYGPPSNDGPSEPANYEFSYEVRDAPSGNDFGHQESRQGDVAIGMYHVMLPDGRMQIVDYTADNEGYKPKVKYEGTASSAGGYNYPTAGGYKY